MAVTEAFDVGVAHLIGRHSDAVRLPGGHDQIVVSGTPGLRPDETLPTDATEEFTQAWCNVKDALTRAGTELSR